MAHHKNKPDSVEKPLPEGIKGVCYSDAEDRFILINSCMTEIEKRCTEAHELIHHELTPGHKIATYFRVAESIPVLKAERKVEKETALELISEERLKEVLARAEDMRESEIAEELGVTVEVLRLRIELYRWRCKIF